MLLDPTDASGRLSPAPAPGLPWLPVAVTLAYINEPPRGVGGTNVSVEDDPGDPNGLLCVAARDIAAGEELFMVGCLFGDWGAGWGVGYGRAAMHVMLLGCRWALSKAVTCVIVPKFGCPVQDYGVTYDRSGYGAPEQQQQQQEPPGASGGAAGQPER